MRFSDTFISCDMDDAALLGKPLILMAMIMRSSFKLGNLPMLSHLSSGRSQRSAGPLECALLSEDQVDITQTVFLYDIL